MRQSGAPLTIEVRRATWRGDRASDVLDQLFRHAWQRRAMTVTGRVDLRLMHALSDSSCVFHRRGASTLLETDRPDILREFESGNAHFSRLDGEWPLRLLAPQQSSPDLRVS